MKRRRGSFFSPLISITLVLFLMGLFGMLVLFAGKLKTYLKENLQVNIYFNDDAKDADITRLEKMLQNETYVLRTDFIDKEEAHAMMTRDLGEDAVEILDFNPFPASLDVYFQSDFATVDSIEKFKKTMEGYPFVKEVSYQKVILENIDRNVRIGGLIILVFLIIFLLIAIVLINNTIRLMLYSQRFLIKTKQLVGATEGFIIRPYILKAVTFGLIGGILACVLLFLIIYLFNTQLMISVLGYNVLPFAAFGDILKNYIILGGMVLSMLVFGVLITAFSSFFSVKRYLKLKLDELY